MSVLWAPRLPQGRSARQFSVPQGRSASKFSVPAGRSASEFSVALVVLSGQVGRLLACARKGGAIVNFEAVLSDYFVFYGFFSDLVNSGRDSYFTYFYENFKFPIFFDAGVFTVSSSRWTSRASAWTSRAAAWTSRAAAWTSRASA